MKRKTKITAITLGIALLALGGCGSNSTAKDNANSAPPSSSQGNTELTLYKGVGHDSVFRVRVDRETNQEKYSTNTVIATAIFDKDGRIIDVEFDTLEIVPESSGEGGAVFPGWPNESISKDTVENNVANWQTKRERGDENYGMNWTEQIDFYQDFFKGKTVDEVEAWFMKNTSDINGRPLSENSSDPKDIEKYNTLSTEEKEILADVTSSASISLKDNHGDFIGALKEAYENKKEISLD